MLSVEELVSTERVVRELVPVEVACAVTAVEFSVYYKHI